MHHQCIPKSSNFFVTNNKNIIATFYHTSFGKSDNLGSQVVFFDVILVA